MPLDDDLPIKGFQHRSQPLDEGLAALGEIGPTYIEERGTSGVNDLDA